MIYNEGTINSIKDILISSEETIAVAESVTAGHLQAAFSAGIDASKYFQGGITAYNIGQKARHLHIDPILGNKVNCVAAKIADTMAIEVAKMFASDYGIGITGYASIVPECEEEGLFAYFSLSYKGELLLSDKLTSPEKLPYEVQVDYAKKVIKRVLECLHSKRKD
jgi:nicotinamide-nucleotide amidase